MKTINYLFAVISLVFITSCETEREEEEREEEPPRFEMVDVSTVETSDGFDIEIFAELDKSINGRIFALIGGLVGSIEFEQMEGSTYVGTRSAICSDFQSSSIIVNVSLEDSRFDDDNSTESTRSLTVNLPCEDGDISGSDDGDDPDPNATADEEIQILQVVNIENQENMFSAALQFTDNTDTSNDASLSMQITRGGDPIGDPTIGGIIGGSNTTAITNFSVNQMLEPNDPDNSDDVYILVIGNVDGDAPRFNFVDASGNLIVDNEGFPVTTITRSFTIGENLMATLSNPSITNTTDTSALISGTINCNCDSNEETEMVAELRVVNNTDVLQTFPNNVPANATSVQFNHMINDLLPNSIYELHLRVLDQEDSFDVITFGTNAVGDIVFAFGTISDIGPNGGFVQMIFTNNTAESIFVDIQINGVDVPQIIIPSGVTQAQQTLVITGQEPSSTVNYVASINGVVQDNGSFMTSNIDYTNVSNRNGAGVVAAQNVTPGATNLNFSDLVIFTDGEGTAQNIIYEFANLPGTATADFVQPWDLISIIGIPGLNTSASQSFWNQVSPGVYQLNLASATGISSIDRNIVSGSNTFEHIATMLQYDGTEPITMLFKAMLVDEQNQIVGEDAQQLVVNF